MTTKTSQNRKPPQTVRDGLREATRQAENGVDRATTQIGDRLEKSAGSVRGGAESVAQGLEGAGDYMHDATARKMGGDATQVIQRHPAVAIGLGVGAGFLLGRLIFHRA